MYIVGHNMDVPPYMYMFLLKTIKCHTFVLCPFLKDDIFYLLSGVVSVWWCCLGPVWWHPAVTRSQHTPHVPVDRPGPAWSALYKPHTLITLVYT